MRQLNIRRIVDAVPRESANLPTRSESYARWLTLWALEQRLAPALRPSKRAQGWCRTSAGVSLLAAWPLVHPDEWCPVQLSRLGRRYVVVHQRNMGRTN